MAHVLTCLKLHKVINYINMRLLRVIKSSIDKSFNKLVKKCFGIGFFKLVRS